MGAALTVLADGLTPGNDEARQWARDAWSDSRGSGPSAADRLGDDIGRWITDRLLDVVGAGKTVPGIIAIIAALVVVALLIYGIRFMRRTPRTAAADVDRSVLSDDPSSARTLRARAESLLAEGDTNGAVVFAMRALTRRCIERTVLDDLPSLTAHEVATRLRPVFADHAADLGAAADLFDRVAYGHASATADEARRLLTLDAELRSARPSAENGVGSGATYAVPR
ncbi:hypothetical protein GOPIP_008_00170 [Gordonia polyisoprenivorans NBRC 16320 = JCM 10675]|uniref:DUF4129 domain-containing protein n=1 Tax=Gordonia polyisoprenivorans TaxID=84595 RepID=A0A846WRI8_9ACTN|nr:MULTISPECIES: DUF4129 domain-containing protein [Gordonia]MDF3284604.1 DUF4129 domain-containing protein [Gordonia sp. N1V]NKY04278.1 DUF4129 domain-containing protein [Gordonia polyisoprenivorans]OPX08580.1 hypothetical protein B1964_26355 [Gordonia sp. i37]WCB37468.1 DUF4129 domain-containing protein [Gordonia polyisoprenivorans]GAB21445.1 hypothetical protein GOPIP_008_00170 [Gordonia polyisoprenivorans NBRC 16320 = JCM 10675]